MGQLDSTCRAPPGAQLLGGFGRRHRRDSEYLGVAVQVVELEKAKL
jgi:hypothetical protein